LLIVVFRFYFRHRFFYFLYLVFIRNIFVFLGYLVRRSCIFFYYFSFSHFFYLFLWILSFISCFYFCANFCIIFLFCLPDLSLSEPASLWLRISWIYMVDKGLIFSSFWFFTSTETSRAISYSLFLNFSLFLILIFL